MKMISVTLEDIVAQTGVESPPDFDYIVICDGSGTRKDVPCGWSGLIFSLWDMEREEFYGGCSGGTNNYAELEPFVYALNRIMNETSALSLPRLLFITDSEVVVRKGIGTYQINKDEILWKCFDGKPNVVWRHTPRNIVPAQILCDTISRELRLVIESYERMP